MQQPVADMRSAFRGYLRDSGLFMTAERAAVFDELVISDGHYDVDELVRRLRKKHRKVSRATVYRTVTLLEESGLINRVDLGHAHSHYECPTRIRHHEHLVCTMCGRVVEFTDPALEQRIADIAADHRFVLKRHAVQLFGVCRECNG